MADIDIERRHHLGMEAARVAAEQMAEDLGRKFGLRGHWAGNVLRFERPGVTGSLAIDGGRVRLTVSLGLLLKAMKSSIERAVHDELDRLFARPRPTRAAAPAHPPARPPARSKKARGGAKKAG